MKILPFTITKSWNESIVTSHEVLDHFYPYYHRHSEIQISLIERSHGTLLYNNEMFAFKSGEVYLIGSDQPHLFRNPKLYYGKDHNDMTETYNVFFNTNGAMSALFDLPEWTATTAFLDRLGLGVVRAGRNQKIQTGIREIVATKGSRKIILFLDFLEELRRHVEVLSKKSGRDFSDLDGSRIGSVIQFLSQNYHREVTLADCARQVNLSNEAMSRYFKKRTGKTLISYLNDLRIHHACDLLHGNRDVSIRDVAYQSGFNNQTHFNRVFLKRTGTTPGRYRRLRTGM